MTRPEILLDTTLSGALGCAAEGPMERSRGPALALIAAMVLALLAIGCASRSDFTAISSKNVNLTGMKIDPSRNRGRASGEDCQHLIIIIPTSGPPTLDEALDRALESKQANLLLDAVVDFHYFFIPYIYGQTCWRAEGEAYDTFE
jgi:hypothetical protein